MSKAHALASSRISAAIVVGGASAARPQDRVDAKVPFAFLVNGVEMPAGNYEVREVNEASGAIAIERTDGRNSVVTMTVPSVSSDEWTDPKLVFDKVENHYVLARIEYGDGEGREIVSRTSETEQDVVTAHSDQK